MSAERCNGWYAIIIEAEGAVHLRPFGGTGWQAVQPDTRVCLGDALRVMAYSRTAVQLPDQVVLRLGQHSSIVFPQPETNSGSRLIELLKGIIHVISRDPRSLSFDTPFVNAGLEGTEFVIAVDDDRTEVTVIEGAVLLSNSAGQVGVPSGQQGVARAAQAPTSAAVARPLDAALWTLHYLPTLDGGTLPAADAAPEAAQRGDPSFYSRRAARRLESGRVDEAGDDLATALALDPRHAEALALQSIIALARQDRASALTLARRAADEDPTSAAALIALSYAQQARFDLIEAEASLERAVAHAPDNAIAWARLAEIRLALTRVEAGTRAAQTAAALDPTLAHAHTVLGFAHLMAPRGQDAAARAFRRAIELQQAAPLPRLGLALALSRQRRPAESREQLELAVLLDPGNALIRSYMGKAYHDEHRDALTESQLELAKLFDPLDPTAWLYDGLRKQAHNRPVEALQDLRQATDLNANQPPYRSRLRLDEDLAVRSAAVGRLHRQLGFEQLAMLQGWRSTTSEPGEYAGHRLLADVYSTLPRHEFSRIHELHQSQLLQPANITPIPAHLGETSLFILDSAGPTDLAFTEFSPLLGGNGVGFEASAVGAGAGTSGENLALAGIHGRVSYSIGHHGFRTDGFRANNDLDQWVTNAFLQVRPNAGTGVQVELRTSRTESGDLRMLFNPANYDARLRRRESSESIRVGLRRDLSDRHQLLVSSIYDDAETILDSAISATGHLDGIAIDVQHLYRGSRWRVTSGVRHLDQRLSDTLALPTAPEASNTTADLAHTNAYSYAHLHFDGGITLSAGGSLDAVDGRVHRGGRFNPKLGLAWEAGPSTLVRAAVFRTLQGPFVSRHNIQPRLEPTHIGGFNQFFFGSEGEDAWRYGVGMDHRLSPNLYAGVELTRRDVVLPVILFAPPAPVTEYVDVEEAAHRAYLYWMPSAAVSLSAEYHYERFDNDGLVLAHGFSDMRTQRLPLRLSYFHRSGLGTTLKATLADQQGHFRSSAATGAAAEHGADRFWVLDMSVGYRLPRRRGLVALDVRNVLDQAFRFQDTDPENPRIIPERMVSLRFTIAY